MAKTYLNTVKYEIKAKYEVEGIVEKPDIVGAIFGQSEGLLGEDMDLKDLQQAGKLGRIEITVNKGKGKTTGEIIIPSSLDQIKTSILAATIETVEKVGPCDTKIQVLKIMDTRQEKRGQITDRAKELLKKMQKFDNVESEELALGIKTDIRTQKLIKLNGLEAGPDAEKSEEIIVVEGRADVLKLLSYGINNAVAMNGSNIDKALIDLCKTKTVTMLIDGDRGGTLNIKKLASLTKVDFVARAPDGKEVEELTQKEILQGLKRKVTLEEFENNKDQVSQRPNQNYDRNNFRRNDSRPNFTPRNTRGGYENRPNFSRGNFPNNNYRNDFRRNDSRPNFTPRDTRGGYENRSFGRDNYRSDFDPFKGNYRTKPATEQPKNKEEKIAVAKALIPKEQTGQIPQNIIAIEKDFVKLKGSLKARLYDEKGKKIKDTPVKELLTVLEKNKKKIKTIAFDGILTKRLVEMAEKKEIENLVGVRRGTAKSDKVKIYTM